MTFNCLIVDDEPIARDILVTYIGQIPYLRLVASCNDAFEAMGILNKGDIDLIVLDINMPRLSGLDMLRTVKKYPAVIITSAYPEFALEGFELSVTDYLLKPFSFPRFVQATEKCVQRLQHSPAIEADAPKEDFIMVKSDKKLTKISLGDISYIEAYGNYIFIYLPGERIMSKQTLTQFESQLPAGKFIRIHKSYIVSLKAVKYLEGNQVSVGSKMLPVGKVFKENLVKHFS
jgi:two-component system, LytTR family, response regulator